MLMDILVHSVSSVCFKMSKKSVAFFLLAICLGIYFQFRSKEGKLVGTKSGYVKGIISLSRDGREFYEWLGIPYAKPPIGNLRFATPQPVDSWNGIFDASQYGSRCAQIDPFLVVAQGDEDCLTLNVHVPKVETGGKKLPVMFFIHGGCYNSMGSWDHRPNYFMDEDVVLVTFHYRLGIFGFLSTGDKSIRGNMGLKDQTLALKWVKKNIEYFGGDPDRITIIGESAGGASVHYQMLSPSSKGLFNQAMSLSGAATNPWSFETTDSTKKRTEEFARKVDCPTRNSQELVKCLRGRTWRELLDAHANEWATFYVVYPHKDGRLFSPTVEAIDDSEAFLTKHPLDILENGLAHRVPWVTGVTSDEGLVSAASACFYTKPETMGLYESNWDENTLRVLGMPPNAANGTEITKKLRNYYFPPGKGSGEHYKQRQYAKMFSDISFNLQMHHAASTQRQFSDVYLYHLSRRGGFSLQTLYLNLHRLNDRSVPMKLVYTVGVFLETTFNHFLLGISPADYGVAHADDLPYLFWMPFVFKISRDEVGGINFSKDLVKLWASFAKNEELSFRGTPLTPINSTGPLQYIDLNDESKTINEPFQDRLQFLQTLHLLKHRS